MLRSHRELILNWFRKNGHLPGLTPLSSPHRTAAIATLCEKLNAAPVVFPGTRLRGRLSH